MKGDPKVLETLNSLLADELAAINQYMVQSEMCDDWGYERLHKQIEKQAIDEMKHAEKLIQRILFLEGSPTVTKLNRIQIGKKVEEFFANNIGSETGAIKAYNEGIALCVASADNGSRELLESILTDEEAHLDWLEAQAGQVEQLGIQIYLAQQIRE